MVGAEVGARVATAAAPAASWAAAMSRTSVVAASMGLLTSLPRLGKRGRGEGACGGGVLELEIFETKGLGACGGAARRCLARVVAALVAATIRGCRRA